MLDVVRNSPSVRRLLENYKKMGITINLIIPTTLAIGGEREIRTLGGG